MSIYPPSFCSLPTLILQYTQSKNVSKFLYINNFSVDYAGLYINWANTSLFIIPGTPPTLKLPIKRHPSSRQLFFWCIFSIKLPWLQSRSNENNIILFDRYYLQNCKAIIFEKIGNHKKYKKPNAPSHLHIFWLNFGKANHSFLHPFLLLGETDFRKNVALGIE